VLPGPSGSAGSDDGDGSPTKRPKVSGTQAQGSDGNDSESDQGQPYQSPPLASSSCAAGGPLPAVPAAPLVALGLAALLGRRRRRAE
jgi:uncharacterized protein (TIGR03382 family)